MAEQGGTDKTQHQNNNEQREKNTATLSKINNAIKAHHPIFSINAKFPKSSLTFDIRREACPRSLVNLSC